MSPINSDEHDAKHGVRSVREQPMATEQRDEPWASSSQQYTAKSKGESVSEAEWRGAKQAEVLRRRTVSTDLHGGKRILAICIVPSCSSPSSSHSSPGFNVISTTLRPAYLIPRYIHASTYFRLILISRGIKPR